MHELSLDRYPARKDDPASPHLWGHPSRMLKHGGHFHSSNWTEPTSLKRPKVTTTGYEGEWLIEPPESLSNASTTGTLVRCMLIAGFTTDEVEEALNDTSNRGGAFWRWKGSREGGEKFQQKLLSNTHLDGITKTLTIIPMETPYRVPVTVNSFHPCPLLKVRDQTGTTHGVKISKNGKILLTHITFPGRLYGSVEKKISLGTWTWKNFTLDIQTSTVLKILSFLTHDYEPMSKNSLKDALKDELRFESYAKGIIEGYLSWMTDEGFITWAKEVHPVPTKTGPRRMPIQVPYLAGKPVDPPQLALSSLDVEWMLTDTWIHECEYLTTG